MLPSARAAAGSSACARWITKSHSSHVNETQAPLSASKAVLSADSYRFISGLWANHGQAKASVGIEIYHLFPCFTCLSITRSGSLSKSRGEVLQAGFFFSTPLWYKMTVAYRRLSVAVWQGGCSLPLTARCWNGWFIKKKKKPKSQDQVFSVFSHARHCVQCLSGRPPL